MNHHRIAVSKTVSPDAHPRGKKFWWRRGCYWGGGLVILAYVVLLFCHEAPRAMKENLDVCMQQYAADHGIPDRALTTDLVYQPEFTEAISLCSATP